MFERRFEHAHIKNAFPKKDTIYKPRTVYHFLRNRSIVAMQFFGGDYERSVQNAVFARNERISQRENIK